MGRMVVPKGMSFLEARAVSPKVMGDYAQHHQDFKAFCLERGHSISSAEEIDDAMETAASRLQRWSSTSKMELIFSTTELQRASVHCFVACS